MNTPVKPLPPEPPEPVETTETSAAGAGEPVQFRLRHLFLATFIVAAITAVAGSFGPGSLPLSIGITLAWMNVRGVFQRWQQPRTRPRICYAAWLLLAASLFLPSARGCNQRTINGWEAARMAATVETVALQSLVEREGVDLLKSCFITAFYTLINLANLMVLLSPLFLYRLQKGKGRLLGNSLAIAVVPCWTLPWEDFGGYFIGYYAWAIGITLLLFIMRLGRRIFWAMVVVGVATAALAEFS